MKILLQHKIFIGYFFLMAIIGSMVAIVLHERNRVQKIEDESITMYPSEQLHLIFPKFSVIFYFFRINNMRQKFMYFVCGVISNICQDINHPLFRIDVV